MPLLQHPPPSLLPMVGAHSLQQQRWHRYGCSGNVMDCIQHSAQRTEHQVPSSKHIKKKVPDQGILCQGVDAAGRILCSRKLLQPAKPILQAA
mmetsp:Transcript_122167/g.237542  ORF Transcript_122167/g.237542 Transcript_122167/m.237542 type:complete len:93 (+) Transcript_122167:83-361(+)